MRVLAVSLVASVKEDGVHVDLFLGTSSATAGPLRDGQEVRLLLEEPEVVQDKQPAVSSRLRRRAAAQEARVVTDAGARVQKASGAIAGIKGDGRDRGRLRIESKATKLKSYSVTRKELEKIRSEATGKEVPAFVISFLDPRTLREDDRWVLIPYEHWNEANVNRRPEG